MASPEETRVKNLESELSLLKNQVQQTLLDIREHVLEFTNPFTAEGRLVRAWQERTAQAAQTNLGGEADLESLLENDDGAKNESAGAVTATAPPPAPIDDDDWDEFEDEEPMDVAPQAAADSSDDLEVNLEPEEYESEPFADFEEEPMADGMWEDPYDDTEYEDEYEDEHEDDVDKEIDDSEEVTEIKLEAEEADGEDVEEEPAAPPELRKESVVEESALPEKDPGMDMITLISLVRWVDKNSERIGKDRVMVILDIYAMSGRITEETRDIVKGLCALGRNDETRVPVRDVVAAMLTIDGVLDERVSESQRLMSMLYDDPLGGMSQDGAGLLP